MEIKKSEIEATSECTVEYTPESKLTRAQLKRKLKNRRQNKLARINRKINKAR